MYARALRDYRDSDHGLDDDFGRRRFDHIDRDDGYHPSSGN
jgi:hypothetical protein